jgi:hypothetical protein
MCPPQWARPFGFQKARPGFIPLFKGAKRDVLFEQRAGFGGGKTMRSGFALSAQEALSGGHAHGEEVKTGLLIEPEVPLPLQELHQRGQKGDQAFDTDGAGRSPGQKQRLLHLGSIHRETRPVPSGG